MSEARSDKYDATFYDVHTADSLRAARIVVPILMSLIQPTSVIDVGCGLGAWLKVFQENNVERVKGLDGPWIDRSKLLIDPASFELIDLDRGVVNDDERYDLAVCLEVVEHLADVPARQLVRSLTTLAPVVLFSAAIPGQGGTHHINEQWPLFWRSEFACHGYVRLDAVRPRILHDRGVPWWYRQNILLYVSRTALAASASLRAEQDPERWETLDVISQDILEDILRRHMSVRGLVAAIPRAAARALQWRVARLLEHHDEPNAHRLLYRVLSTARRWKASRLSMQNQHKR